MKLQRRSELGLALLCIYLARSKSCLLTLLLHMLHQVPVQLPIWTAPRNHNKMQQRCRSSANKEQRFMAMQHFKQASSVIAMLPGPNPNPNPIPNPIPNPDPNPDPNDFHDSIPMSHPNEPCICKLLVICAPIMCN